MMRCTIMLIACLAAGSSGLAQDTYMSMMEEDRTWCGVEGGWLPTPVTYSVAMDTTMADGSLWHRMEVQYEGSPTSGFAGWFHENQEAGEVWMRWDLDADPGTLWFDFSLEPGETMMAPNCIEQEITCIAVEPFTWTDGTVSRRLTMQLLSDNINFTEYWIEGIGSENGPMGPAAYLCIADWDPRAACVTQNGGLRHDFELDTTWLPAHPGCLDSLTPSNVPIASQAGQLQVYNGALHWSGTHPPHSIALYDLMGRALEACGCPLPCPIPSTKGIIIAVMPDGRRQKLRID